MIIGLIIFIIGALYMGAALLSVLGGVALSDVIINVIYAALNMALGMGVYMRVNSSLSNQTFAQRIRAINTINAYPIEGTRLPIAVKCSIVLSPKKVYFDFVDPLDPDLAQRYDMLNLDEITAVGLILNGTLEDSLVKQFSETENKLVMGNAWQVETANPLGKTSRVYLILNYISVSGETKPFVFRLEDDEAQIKNFFNDLKYFASKYNIREMCSMKHD